MTLTEQFVRVAFCVGAAYMVATAVIGVCAAWWYALGKIRKCAYETYLLADMHVWMKKHSTGREPADD